MMRFVFLAAGLIMAAAACNSEITGLEPPSNPATETFDPSLGVNIGQMTKLATGTYISDLRVGTGDLVMLTSDTVWVTYSGRLKDGKLFDSGTNVKFEFGLFGLVSGFRNGIVGMKVGGERLIVIPSEQGYGGQSRRGADGKISIPRQSTLVFKVELLKVHTPAPTTPTA